MIRVTYGKATVEMQPIDKTPGGGVSYAAQEILKKGGNYDANDLAQATAAVVRSWGMDMERFVEMMNAKPDEVEV